MGVSEVLLCMYALSIGAKIKEDVRQQYLRPTLRTKTETEDKVELLRDGGRN